MLRCAPQRGTPYVPGCQVLVGSVVEVCSCEGNEKYALVRVHSMLGYIRRRHLCPIPTSPMVAQQRRRACVIMWALSRKMGIPPIACVDVVSNFAWEAVPWWLLRGLSLSHRALFCNGLLADPPRSNKVSLSACRRRELAKSLNSWKALFAKHHGRSPHELDVFTDHTVAQMYQEYEAIGKSRQRENRHELSDHDYERRKHLCRELRKWMGDYEAVNRRPASRKKLELDPGVRHLYREYVQLTSRAKRASSLSPPSVSNDQAQPLPDTDLNCPTSSMADVYNSDPMHDHDDRLDTMKPADDTVSAGSTSPSPVSPHEHLDDECSGTDKFLTPTPSRRRPTSSSPANSHQPVGSHGSIVI
ncbi:hypothetical protein DIPPA_03896 [Diplonema papillatum]|nr:hypothetical protein DIPPA_03896 [Diplonema papillatum]